MFFFILAFFHCSVHWKLLRKHRAHKTETDFRNCVENFSYASRSHSMAFLSSSLVHFFVDAAKATAQSSVDCRPKKQKHQMDVPSNLFVSFYFHFFFRFVCFFSFLFGKCFSKSQLCPALTNRTETFHNLLHWHPFSA